MVHRAENVPGRNSLNTPHESSVNRSYQLGLLALVLLIGLSLRLPAIDQPFVDAWSYRQSDVAMVARNFYRYGYNIFWPRIDYGGAQPGYVGMEFPVVPYLAAVFYQLAGEHEAIGRSISVIFFLLSLPPLFLLVQMFRNSRAAFFATCAYSVMPLTIFSGRSFMSDMTAYSFAIWALWLFACWTERKSRWTLVSAALAMALAILIKAPYAVLGLPMAYLSLRKFGLLRSLTSADLWLFGFLALTPAALWYLHAAEMTQSYYPNIPFLGHPDKFFAPLPAEKYLRILERVVWWVTPILFFLGITAFFLPEAKAWRWFFIWWFVGLALLIVISGDDSFGHPWYQLPITAAIASLAGITIDWLLAQSSHKLRFPIVVALVIGGCFIAYQSYSVVRTQFTPFAEPLREAGVAADRLLPKNALLLFATWGDPTTVYYSKRHGWLFHEHFVAPKNGAEAISMLEMRRREGASYFVASSRESYLREEPYSSFWQYLERHFTLVISAPDFTIFDIRNKTNATVGTP